MIETELQKVNIIFNNHNYINNCTITYDFSEIDENNKVISFLKYINYNDLKMISLMSQEFLIYCADIKYYFKDIIINFYMVNDIDNNNLIFLNYVDNIFCSKKDYIDKLNNLKIFNQLKRPNIDFIQVITFGTFDLFHIGHEKILQRAKAFGNLIVGVSTDELNIKKNKKSVNDLEKRKTDVFNTKYADLIFDEESLELKNDYVNKYNCNLLIMGDDWKDKFNFCDCACIYLQRTPDISTTLLKQLIGFI